MTDLDKEIESPCIGVCAIDDLTGLCEGCFRTMDEIQGWWDLENKDKTKIVEAASERQEELFN